jgi:hypothetical protein
MTTSWTLAMGRDDFARTALVYAPPDLSDGSGSVTQTPGQALVSADAGRF